LTVAHAGEEGSAEDVRKYLKLLKISRINHGNRNIDDEKLVEELADRKITLTSCPLSNYNLKVVKKNGEKSSKADAKKGPKSDCKF